MNPQTFLALLIASLPLATQAAPDRYLDETDALRVIGVRSSTSARLAELDALCQADAGRSASSTTSRSGDRDDLPSAGELATRPSRPVHGREHEQGERRDEARHDGHDDHASAGHEAHHGHDDWARYHGAETLPQANPVAAVPLPASAWLLVVGLFGLGGSRLRGGRLSKAGADRSSVRSGALQAA